MKTLLAGLLLSCAVAVNAGNMRAVNVLTVRNGLPADDVRQVFQDSEGFIWIATYDGLCRFDGYDLKTYKSNLYTPNLLSSNRLNCIEEDADDRIWIGTENGLNVLSKRTGEIRQFPSETFVNGQIRVLLHEGSNNVWIGTENGLYKYFAQTDSIVRYDASNTDNSFRGWNIKTLCKDNEGNIWIGTWSEGLYRYNEAENRFYEYPCINEQNSAHVIYQDNDLHIWVGTWGHGLVRIENPYSHDNVRYINYLQRDENSGSLLDNTIYAISQDLNTGDIWVGGRSGLSILKDKNDANSFTNYLPGQSVLPYNELNSIMRDNTGMMWLGMLGGGVCAVSTEESVFQANTLEQVRKVKATGNVRSFYIDDSGIVWMGIGSAGLVTFTPSTGKYTFMEEHPDFKDNPIIGSVYSIKKIGGAYWFTSFGQGVFIYKEGEKVKRLDNTTQPALNDSRTYCIEEDLNGNVWIGSAEGVCVFEPASAKIVAYPLLGLQNEGGRYAVYDILQSDRRTIWLATAENGVVRLAIDPETSRILSAQRYSTQNAKLNNDHILCLFRDSKGTIWIGSEGGGLSRYEEHKDAFVCVHREYNLPGDGVSFIAEDGADALWVGTNAGLVLLAGDKARNFTIANGLLDNYFNRNAVFSAHNGEVFVGCHSGYNSFVSEKIKANEFVTPLTVTDIKIYNRSLELIDSKLRQQISAEAPGYTRKISLPYNHNNFSIEFAAMNYLNPMQNTYAYRLTGFEDEWQYTDASRRFASYNNLKSGTYRFQLKALNDSGVWNEAPDLTVEILPAFWQTWQAYLLYIIALCLIAFAVIKTARNRLLMLNEIRLKDMEKQKIEELNHAKLQFFTNITHEFLTPLTILSASLDDLKIISPQHNEYYNSMSSNITRLIRLLQQILEFRKAETGNLKLKVSKGDLAQFVRNSVENFTPLMKQKKIHLSLMCDPEMIPALFDHDKMDKILFNLLSNAAKYNKPGGFVQVDLQYRSPDRRDYAVLTVKDNGEGIPRKELSGLFKRFYEGDYRRFNTIGTGIGLSLTKDLVTLHKGEITVESDEGQGSTFKVTIPIEATFYNEAETDACSYAATASGAAASSTASTASGGGASGVTTAAVGGASTVAGASAIGGAGAANASAESSPHAANASSPEATPHREHTLLLIEDNEELLQVMVRLLSREYNVFTARNGVEGVQVLENEYIDLAISDIMMPEMDGIEFCKYVKNKFEISHVPVILLTAKNKEEDRIDAYDSGADGFISKPFNLNVLHSKIKNLLKSRKRAAREFNKKFEVEAGDANYTSLDEKFLKRAVECVTAHIEDAEFDQQQFADALGVSKATLYRKLQSLTAHNTSSFIRALRLKTACKIIEEKRKIRISELAYAVGFNDPKYFSACFKKAFGMLPTEYAEMGEERFGKF